MEKDKGWCVWQKRRAPRPKEKKVKERKSRRGFNKKDVARQLVIALGCHGGVVFCCGKNRTSFGDKSMGREFDQITRAIWNLVAG